MQPKFYSENQEGFLFTYFYNPTPLTELYYDVYVWNNTVGNAEICLQYGNAKQCIRMFLWQFIAKPTPLRDNILPLILKQGVIGFTQS